MRRNTPVKRYEPSVFVEGLLKENPDFDFTDFSEKDMHNGVDHVAADTSEETEH